ncbi:MAG: hypothetical protein DWH77_00785 [Planctomycetota bacterium]|nr:MAG: hypothetical protein DWH77_00785 [Planctomycetota bacterium]
MSRSCDCAAVATNCCAGSVAAGAFALAGSAAGSSVGSAAGSAVGSSTGGSMGSSPCIMAFDCEDPLIKLTARTAERIVKERSIWSNN